MNIREGYARVLAKFKEGERGGICHAVERVVKGDISVGEDYTFHPLFKHWNAMGVEIKLARIQQGDSPFDWFCGHWMARGSEFWNSGVTRRRRIRTLKCLARGHRAEAIKQACI